MTAHAWLGLGMARPVAITEVADLLRSEHVSAVDAARESIAAIEASQPAINAFIRVTDDLALAQARHVDVLRAAGTDLGALMGVPIAVKDLFDVAGVPTTAGSRLFADRVANEDAEAVRRLVAAGAVIVGKANMDQFAMGPHQDDYGRTNCPADATRYAGGSSGGSAAAVAAGLVVAALGTDAGGSTRHPAACCGVVGFKPTFGVVPTEGVFPTFASVDHAGVIASDVPGTRAVFEVISDAPGVPAGNARPPRIAVLGGWQEGCDDHVTDRIDSALAELADAGATLRPWHRGHRVRRFEQHAGRHCQTGGVCGAGRAPARERRRRSGSIPDVAGFREPNLRCQLSAGAGEQKPDAGRHRCRPSAARRPRHANIGRSRMALGRHR